MSVDLCIFIDDINLNLSVKITDYLYNSISFLVFRQ